MVKKVRGKVSLIGRDPLLLFVHVHTRGNPTTGHVSSGRNNRKKEGTPTSVAHVHAITSDNTTTSNVTL